MQTVKSCRRKTSGVSAGRNIPDSPFCQDGLKYNREKVTAIWDAGASVRKSHDSGTPNVEKIRLAAEPLAGRRFGGFLELAQARWTAGFFPLAVRDFLAVLLCVIWSALWSLPPNPTILRRRRRDLTIAGSIASRL